MKKFDNYFSRYHLVARSLVPCADCQAIGVLQTEMLSELAREIDSVDKCDWDRAAALIQSSLVPFMDERQITKQKANYSSKYYDQKTQ